MLLMLKLWILIFCGSMLVLMVLTGGGGPETVASLMIASFGITLALTSTASYAAMLMRQSENPSTRKEPTGAAESPAAKQPSP